MYGIYFVRKTGFGVMQITCWELQKVAGCGETETPVRGLL